MENQDNKETKKQISGILQFLMWFIIIWEGIKWFHKKFGITGDIVLIGLLAYLIYSTPSFGFVKPHQFPQNTDKPMWKK